MIKEILKTILAGVLVGGALFFMPFVMVKIIIILLVFRLAFKLLGFGHRGYWMHKYNNMTDEQKAAFKAKFGKKCCGHHDTPKTETV